MGQQCDPKPHPPRAILYMHDTVLQCEWHSDSTCTNQELREIASAKFNTSVGLIEVRGEFSQGQDVFTKMVVTGVMLPVCADVFAKLCSLSKCQTRDLIRSGQLPAIEVDRRLRVVADGMLGKRLAFPSSKR